MNEKELLEVIDSYQSEEYWNKVLPKRIPPIKIKKDFNIELMEFYQSLIKRTTPFVDRWEKELNLEHTCKAGCNHCCHQLVEIYDFELISILTYIKQEHLEGLLNTTLTTADYIEKNLSYSQMDIESLSDRDLLDYKMKYRELGIPCVFLKDKKCLIYAVRPTNCATYYSYGPAEKCAQIHELPIYCKSFGEMEDWIIDQIIAFIKYNRKKTPKGLDPFKIKILPIAIRDYLTSLKLE